MPCISTVRRCMHRAPVTPWPCRYGSIRRWLPRILFASPAIYRQCVRQPGSASVTTGVGVLVPKAGLVPEAASTHYHLHPLPPMTLPDSNAQARALIAPLRRAMADFEPDSLRNALASLFHPRAVVHLATPFEDLPGAEGLFGEALQPLHR